jgi:hypothetical protein
MTWLMEIRKGRGFPQPLAKPCWVSHISHRPDGGDHSQRSIFQRQRSILETPISCPKDGEYLKRFPRRTIALEAKAHQLSIAVCAV